MTTTRAAIQPLDIAVNAAQGSDLIALGMFVNDAIALVLSTRKY